MLSAIDRIEERKKNFQKGIDAEELRRRREEGAVELRKKKRNEHISKKRALSTQAGKSAMEVDERRSQQIVFDAMLIPQELISIEPQFISAEITPYDRLNLLLSLISSSDDILLLRLSVQTLRKVISAETSPPLEQVGGSGIVDRLISLLDTVDDELKFESAWCLTNLATGPSDVTNTLVEAGVVEKLFGLLSHPHPELVDQCVWALGNIAGDSISSRDRIIAAGTVELIVKKIEKIATIQAQYLANMVWLLSNLIRGKPTPPKEVTDNIMGILPTLLNSPCDKVLTDACWCASYMSDGDSMSIQSIIDKNLTARILELMSHSCPLVQAPAIRTVGNITSGSDSQLQILINLGVVDKLAGILPSSRKNIRKEILWALSNIAAGTPEQIELLVTHPIFRLIVEASKDPDFEIKKEAVWALSNATHVKNVSLLMRMVKLGIFDRMVESLQHQDSRILLMALEGVNNLLRAGKEVMLGEKNSGFNELAVRFDEMGGLNRLEDLQTHPNAKVYNKVVAIMDEHFGLEEVTDENTMGGSNVVAPGNFVFT